MISFKRATKLALPPCEWIFFSSKNAVKFFYQSGYTDDSKKVACVGEGTMKVLAKYRKQIDFVGNDVDIDRIAKKFKIKLGKSSCLFPVSDISKETIQSALKPEQVENLVVYTTKEQPQIIDPPCDILVFTSPSNARAYFQVNQLLTHQKIVAIGPSTAKQIKDLGYPVDQISRQPGELGMIDAIDALIL